MDIKQNNNGFTFINQAGATVNLNWYEFWEICRHGRMIDAVSEVIEYVRECDEIAGVSVDKILNNDEWIEEIADEVITKRIGYESPDDIWYVVNALIKRGKIK